MKLLISLLFFPARTNDVNTSNEIKPIILETSSSDTAKIQVSEHDSVFTNSSLLEISEHDREFTNGVHEISEHHPVPANGSFKERQNDGEESIRVQLNSEETVDELKSSTDDDTIINSFVTVEMPPLANPQFESPPFDAETSNSDKLNAVNDDFKSDLTLNDEITPAENNFTINSPSLTDSDSIDIPDDSFIVCDDPNSNHASDFLATSENCAEKFDPTFGEFVTSNDDQMSGFQVEDHEDHVLSNAVSDNIAVLNTDFETDFQSSDDFFQPFADVSTSFSSEKVTKLELTNVFGAEINDPLSDPLSDIVQTTRDSQVEEIAPVQFSCEFDDDDDDDFSDFVSPTTFMASKMAEESTYDPVKIQPDKIEDIPASFCPTNEFPMNEKCFFEQDRVSTTSNEVNWTEIFCAPVEVGKNYRVFLLSSTKFDFY